MRRELPAEQKREAERRQRRMTKAVAALSRARSELGSLDGMTGKPEADEELAQALDRISSALKILS